MIQWCVVYKKISKCRRNLFFARLGVLKWRRNRSQSRFWSHSFVPHRKWDLTLLVHQNMRKEKRYGKFFLVYLSVHWGDLIEQIKNICHIQFKFNCSLGNRYFWRCMLEHTKRQVHKWKILQHALSTSYVYNRSLFVIFTQMKAIIGETIRSQFRYIKILTSLRGLGKYCKRI